MSYWCDDRKLLIEQRRLEAQQQRALQKIRRRFECMCPYGEPCPVHPDDLIDERDE